MDDVPGRKGVPPGQAGFAGLTPAKPTAFGEQSRSGRTMNRPIHAAAAKQRRIRRVHDCVHLQTGDVTFDDGQTGHDSSSHSCLLFG
jgi:hypothetical protein